MKSVSSSDDPMAVVREDVGHLADDFSNRSSSQGSDSGFFHQLSVLISHKESILGMTLIFTCLAAMIGLLISPVFRAETNVFFLPTVLVSEAENGYGQVDLTGFRGGDSPEIDTQLYFIVEMIKSRLLLERVVKGLDLIDHYGTDGLNGARDKLFRALSAQVDQRSKVIKIIVDDGDSVQSAVIANAVVEELQMVLKDILVSRAREERFFLEEQLKEVKLDLLEAEGALERYQMKTGILNVDTQTTSLMESISSLKAQIASRTVELQATRTFATAINPSVKRLRTEIAGLQKELQKLEAKVGDGEMGTLSLKKLSGEGIEYLRRVREFRFNETLYGMLLQQYRAARIKELSQPVVVHVVDKAIPPPKRNNSIFGRLVFLGAILGFFLSVCYVMINSFLMDASSDPRYRIDMALIKEHQRFSWKKLFEL